VLGNIAVALGATPLSGLGDVTRILVPTDGLWRGVIYGLEPPLVLLLSGVRNAEALRANPFFAAEPPPPAFIAWSIVWIAIVLLAGVALFRRREL